MGDHQGWAQPSGLLPNGLLPKEENCVTRELDRERWSIAEERTEELIARIQPNPPSEELRNAVADYVQRLIMKCFSCQVFTFGSVPLKTYLPDGDIDLTAFSKNQNLKDTWANEVRIMLENEEKSVNAEFRVKEVQYIQAEVKLIKCLVENIVVDISFNQLGGLCTLCFLEEVDQLIGQNHLFKRSIILIKAWCYYESRILGAHHGLISTYALETLVLYIFHVFNNSLAGPLEVLYRFLEFFSNFDWENFCVSLWGPVPIRSLPDMTAVSPRRDGGELLLSKLFLDSCSTVYAVFQGGQENHGQHFVSKHFNVVDPLRTNNNLGRSVSKGNFFRIRSAFGYGAKRLARLLDCPKDDIVTEVNQFFMNTWERHGSGQRPDAPTDCLIRLRRLNSEHLNRLENLRNRSSSKKKNESLTIHESENDRNHTFQGIPYQHRNQDLPRTSHMPSVSHRQSHNSSGYRTSPREADQVTLYDGSNQSVDNQKGEGISKPAYLGNNRQERFQFVRTRSSPDLLNTSVEASSRGRHNRVPNTGKNHSDSVRPDHNNGNILDSEVSSIPSVSDPSSFRYVPPHQSLEASSDSNRYCDEAGLSTFGEELSSLSETMEMHQEEQDLVNMMASSGFHGFNGQFQMPMHMGAPRMPFPISPSVLASMGYSQRNMSGMLPGNVPLGEPHWGTNIQFPQGMISPNLSHYFSSMGLSTNPEEMVDSGSVNPELSQEHYNQDFWNEHENGSARDFSDTNGHMHPMQFDDKQHSTSVGHNFVSSSHNSSGSSFTRDHHYSLKESRGLVRDDQDDTLHHQNNRENDGQSSERNINLRSLATSHTSSSRSKASSESSRDELTVKVSKSARDKRGRKAAPSPVSPTVYGKGKNGSQYDRFLVDHGSSHAEDDIRDWIPLTALGTELAERSAGPTSASSSHIQSWQMPNYDPTQMSGSDSMIPVAPMVLGSGSRQRVMDNPGIVPLTFYPTGPPVPFLTMLPVYNFPTETGNSDGSSSHVENESSHRHQSDQNHSSECIDQSETSIPANNGAPCEESKTDILNSDFQSHWENLQYGRFCQNPRHHGPMLYHSPLVVPPMYLQGHFQWDGPGRPHSSNMNFFNQLMGHGHHFLPITPLQPGPNRPPGGYQHYGDEVPRYRGTGTYLPNLQKVSQRDRSSYGNRNHRGNYNYDHFSEREGNWNSRPRYSGRRYSRSQSDKGSSRSDRHPANDNRANRPWDSYRHDSFPAYHQQNGRLGPMNSANNGASSDAHGMYPMQAMNSNGVTPNGPGIRPLVMLYPYDSSVGLGSTPDQVEFGSLGPVHLSGMNEASQQGEGSSGRSVREQQQRFQGGSGLSSPDQPSSPQFQRLATGQRNYQLKDEDFPPLSFPSHGGNSNGKLSHYQTILFTSNS